MCLWLLQLLYDIAAFRLCSTDQDTTLLSVQSLNLRRCPMNEFELAGFAAVERHWRQRLSISLYQWYKIPVKGASRHLIASWLADNYVGNHNFRSLSLMCSWIPQKAMRWACNSLNSVVMSLDWVLRHSVQCSTYDIVIQNFEWKNLANIVHWTGSITGYGWAGSKGDAI